MMNFKRKAKVFFCKTQASIAASFTKLEKKVVFESFHGKQYSDNPRAISEKMHEMYPDYELVWGFSDLQTVSNIIPPYVKAYNIASLRYIRERASAVAYVRNEAITDEIIKKPDQLFIQTWHGDRGIKKILYDATEKGKRKSDILDCKLTDLFVVGSDYAENRIKTAFEYAGKTLKAGCPRNDCLVFPKDGSVIKDSIGIPHNKKILLYAPTLRRGNGIVRGLLDIRETVQHLSQHGDEWICLVRAHPKSLGLKVDNEDLVVDVSRYPDMADLLMIADMLITDYSSSAGDFVLRDKPLILAQFDLDQYVEEQRSFFVDPGKVGFIIAKDQAELNHIIDSTNEKTYKSNCQEIKRFFGTTETGESASAVCEYINGYWNKFEGKTK